MRWVRIRVKIYKMILIITNSPEVLYYPGEVVSVDYNYRKERTEDVSDATLAKLNRALKEKALTDDVVQDIPGGVSFGIRIVRAARKADKSDKAGKARAGSRPPR